MGKLDWSKENIGRLNTARFHATPTAKRLYVSTESNMIAALNFRTGELVWRHQLSHPIDKLLLYGRVLFTISNHGKHLALWNAEDGVLMWDDLTYNSSALTLKESEVLIDAIIIQDSELGTPMVSTLVGGLLQLRSLFDGRLLWTTGSLNRIKYQKLAMTNNQLVGVRIVDRKILVDFIKLRNPAVVSEKALSSGYLEGKLRTDQFLLLNGNGGLAVLAWQEDGHKLIISRLTNDAVPSVHEVEKLLPPSIGTKEMLKQLGQAKLLVSNQQEFESSFVIKVNDDLHFVFRLDERNSQKIEFITDFTKHRVFSAPVRAGAGKFLASLITNSDHTEIDIIDIGKAQINRVSFPWTEKGRDMVPISMVFFDVFTKRDSSIGWRMAVVCVDGAILFYQEHASDQLWAREESLAFIEHPVEAVDFPDEKSSPFSIHDVLLNDEDEDTFHHLMKSIFGSSAEEANHFPLIPSALRQTLLIRRAVLNLIHGSRQKLPSSNKVIMGRDKFGSRKIIVARTEASTVFGIHSDRGDILWKRYFKNSKLKGLYLTRSSSFGLPEIVVLVERPTWNGNFETELVWLNPLNGQTTSRQQLPFGSIYSTILPYHDQNGNHILVLLDHQRNVHIFPKTDECRNLFAKKSNGIYYHEINSTSNQITGYHIASLQNDLENSATPTPMWTIVIPPNEVIQEVAAHQSNEKSNSPVKVLGDGSILTKYLNKNLIALAAVTPVTNAKNNVPSVHLYLLDTVTGAIIHHVVHSHAQGPVKLVLSENWVSFMYWNTKSHRFEVSVLEIYYQNENWIWKSGNVFSSYTSNKKLNILQQTYVFSSEIKAMGVTVTARGITPKQLLFALGTNQIIAVDKNLVDPRRPMKDNYTTEAREEGLVPYSTRLSPSILATLSYNKTIYDINHIQSFPTLMESTSLVFCYGLDIFFSKVQPAKGFDMLTDSFNHLVVVATMTVLLSAAFVSGVLARRKELAKAWS